MDVEKYNSLFSKKEIKEVAEPLRRKSNLKDNLLNVPKIVVAINSIETFHPIKNILESLSFKPELYEPEPSALLDFEQPSLSSPRDLSKAAEAKPIFQNDNEINYSGLLITPKKIDDWFTVIDDMTKEFYSSHGKIPNETQAWGALCAKPPKGYEITLGNDRGEQCLVMVGTASLGKRAFKERWKKYTAKNQDKTF